MDTVIDRIGELLSQLQSPDFYDREEAVRELGNYNQDEAVAGLVMSIEDADLGIRELAANLLTQIKGDIASRLLIRFLGHADIGTRNLAAEVLVKINGDAVEPLIEDINNDDYDIRKFIIDVLGLIKDQRAVEPICNKLWDENENVACSAAEALGELGSAEAIPALIAAIERVPDAQLQVVEALGKIGDSTTLEHLYGLMDSDDPMVQYAVIEAIGQIGSPNSVRKLQPFLDNKDKSIAETALGAIVSISEASDGKIDPDLDLSKFTDFLFEGIKNGNRELANFTLNRIGSWSGLDVVEQLLDIIDIVDDDHKERISNILSEAGLSAANLILGKFATATTTSKLTLLDVIGRFINDKIADGLTTCAGDLEPDVRKEIARVLGVSGWTGAVPTLKILTQDSVGHVRSAAYSALGWLATEDEIDFLFDGLDDEYPDVRQAAMGALIIVGSEKVVKKFSEDLYHEDVERQRLAVAAMGMIGDVGVVKPLLDALNHPDPSVRKLSASSLGRIREVADIQPLIRALSDENTAVRKAAVTALIAIKGGDIITDIRYLLDDEDLWVRYHTLNAIGELGIEDNAEYVLPYLDDSQDVIKIATIKALAQMGCSQILPRLHELYQDQNKDVVEAVEMAVSNLEESK